MMKTSFKRMRRLRGSEELRALVRENKISSEELIYPIFVTEGENKRIPIPSMPGIYQYSIDQLDGILLQMKESHIGGILIFGVPAQKDAMGSEAYNDQGITQRAIRFIKEKEPKLLIIADVCLCEYTSHGHCGLVCDGIVLNDETLPLLSKTAVSLVKAGADIIAPSDMMDGRVGAIREALDEHGFYRIPIMSYSAKYASGYYAPFRDAAQSAPQFGDRKTYQMDPCNRKEALLEVEEDLTEGADMIIVKPALAYLDMLKEISQRFLCPVAAYNVSGEYAMVKAASENGWIDEKKIVMENVLGMKRAGAQIIITYHALDIARWLKGDAE